MEAVTSELVSAAFFPVWGENTAKFADFSLEATMERHLCSECSIAYLRNSLSKRSGKHVRLIGNGTMGGNTSLKALNDAWKGKVSRNSISD